MSNFSAYKEDDSDKVTIFISMSLKETPMVVGELIATLFDKGILSEEDCKKILHSQ